MAGEVVGITTSHIGSGQNLNFAVPINALKSLRTEASRIHPFPDEPKDQPEEESGTGETGPTLAETDSWLSQTFSKNAGWPGFYDYTLEVHGCNAELFAHGISFYGRSWRETGLQHKYYFKLSDLDPAITFSRFVPDHGRPDVAYAELKITTRDSKKAIIEASWNMDKSYHMVGGQNRYSVEEINPLFGPIVDLDYAPRFVKALSHAIALCEGKPSTF